MMDQKATLLRRPGGTLVGTGTLKDILAQFDALSDAQKPSHFIIYGDESFSGEEIAKLRSR
jgi:hypothetical protein